MIVPTRFGLLRHDEQGSQHAWVRATELEGVYTQLRDCTISNDGVRMACIRDQKIFVIDTTLQPTTTPSVSGSTSIAAPPASPSWIPI